MPSEILVENMHIPDRKISLASFLYVNTFSCINSPVKIAPKRSVCVCVCVCAKPNTGNFNQSFFTPTNRVCTGGLSYADVITKFSVIDRFPFSFGYEAPLCARTLLH